jgi:hypothetical protein
MASEIIPVRLCFTDNKTTIFDQLSESLCSRSKMVADAVLEKE